MKDFVMNYYLYIKAFHIIAFISWMVGLLYLPRLFVYHTGAKIGSEMYSTFLIMERKLLRYIMLPSMLLTIFFGGLLIMQLDFSTAKWLHWKLLAVLCLIAIHHYLQRCHKNFSINRNKHGDKFYRILNEMPTIFMIIIVMIAVLKP